MAQSFSNMISGALKTRRPMIHRRPQAQQLPDVAVSKKLVDKVSVKRRTKNEGFLR